MSTALGQSANVSEIDAPMMMGEETATFAARLEDDGQELVRNLFFNIPIDVFAYQFNLCRYI